MRLLPVILVALLAGCASEARIVREPPATLQEIAPEYRVVKVWSAGAGDGADGYALEFRPVLESGVIYTADRDGDVFALTAENGKRLWKVSLDVPITTGVAVGDDLLVVGTSKGEVVALDRSGGAVRWRARTSSEILAPAAIRAGVVVVQSVDGRVQGLAASSGRQLWMLDRTEPALSLRGTGQPVLLGEYVFAGFANGKVVGLHLRDGRSLWETSVAVPRGRSEIERLVDVDSPVLVLGDTLFAAAYQGKLIAVDLKSGRLNWSRDLSTSMPLAADARSVFVTEESGAISAYDQRTGSRLWRHDALRARQVTGPAYGEGLVVAGDFEGYLHWFAADDGHAVARYRMGSDRIRAAAVSGNGVFYVADEDGDIVALKVEHP